MDETRRNQLVAIHRRCSAAAQNHENNHGTNSTEQQQQQQQQQQQPQIRSHLAPTINKLQPILNQLRQKRLALAAQLEECRQQQINSCRGTLLSELEQQQKYNEESGIIVSQPDKINHNIHNTTTSLLQNVVKQQRMAVQMQQIRQRRCLQAAYRLAGISIFAMKDLLALRLDVCSACYHCFFDIVTELHDNCDETSTDNEKMYLRLVQHTLPAAVPLAAIVQRHLGGIALLHATTTTTTTVDGVGKVGSKKNEKKVHTFVKVRPLIIKLRACANEIYQACHNLAVRNETIAYLRQFEIHRSSVSTNNPKSNDKPNEDITNQTNVPSWTQTHISSSVLPSPDHCPTLSHCTIDHLECYGASKINFQLHHRLSGITTVYVSLQYPTDLCRTRAQQPIHVKIRTSRRPEGSYEEPTKISYQEEEDDEDLEEFVESAVLSFRRLPIHKALQQVADAMVDW